MKDYKIEYTRGTGAGSRGPAQEQGRNVRNRDASSDRTEGKVSGHQIQEQEHEDGDGQIEQEDRGPASVGKAREVERSESENY